MTDASYFQWVKRESERAWASRSDEEHRGDASWSGVAPSASTRWRPGWSEAEIADVEARFQVRFPDAYRAMLRVMGGTTPMQRVSKWRDGSLRAVEPTTGWLDARFDEAEVRARLAGLPEALWPSHADDAKDEEGGPLYRFSAAFGPDPGERGARRAAIARWLADAPPVWPLHDDFFLVLDDSSGTAPVLQIGSCEEVHAIGINIEDYLPGALKLPQDAAPAYDRIMWWRWSPSHVRAWGDVISDPWAKEPSTAEPSAPADVASSPVAPPVAPPEAATALLGHTNFVQALAFSPDSAWLVSGSEDATMRVWEVATGALRAVLTEHGSAVNSVAFTPDGARLLSASDDATVRVWDARAWTLERTLDGHQGYVREVRPAGDGRAVSAGDDGDMRVWCLDSGECERTLPIGDRPCGLDTSPDGSLALVSSTDFALRVWDLRSGAMVFRLPGEILRPDSGDRDDAGKHLGCACHIEWGGDGRRACSASSTELIEWETETWTEVGYIHGGDVRFDGFSRLAGTRRVVFALHDEIVVYELDGRARVASAAWAHGGATRMTATSPDGRWVACGSQAGPVGLWSVASFAGPVER